MIGEHHALVPSTHRFIDGEWTVTEWRLVLLDAMDDPIDESCNCDIDYEGRMVECNYPPCVMHQDLYRRSWGCYS